MLARRGLGGVRVCPQPSLGQSSLTTPQRAMCLLGFKSTKELAMLGDGAGVAHEPASFAGQWDSQP